MWMVIKDLYTNVKAQVLYAGSLSRKIDVSQGKVEFLRHLCTKYMSMGFYVCQLNHCYAIFINELRIPSLHLQMILLYLRCIRPFLSNVLVVGTSSSDSSTTF